MKTKDLCPHCGGTLGGVAAFCPSCGEGVRRVRRADAGPAARDRGSVRDALFLQRVVALGVDAIPDLAASAALGWALGAAGLMPWPAAAAVGWLVGGRLYLALMEAGPRQATLGKAVAGLRVTDEEGGRLGFGRALLRAFAKVISALPFCVGFMMAASPEGLAWHDRVTGTRVRSLS